MVRRLYTLEEVTSLDGNELMETCHISLMAVEGLLSPNNKVLDKDINCFGVVPGFDGNKNHLLPYLHSAVDEGGITQNPGD